MIDAHSIVSQLPYAVEAVFFSASASAEEIANAQAVHAKLLAAYGLTDGQRGAPPLLLLDLPGGGNHPFALPNKAWLEKGRE